MDQVQAQFCPPQHITSAALTALQSVFLSDKNYFSRPLLTSLSLPCLLKLFFSHSASHSVFLCLSDSVSLFLSLSLPSTPPLSSPSSPICTVTKRMCNLAFSRPALPCSSSVPGICASGPVSVNEIRGKSRALLVNEPASEANV